MSICNAAIFSPVIFNKPAKYKLKSNNEKSGSVYFGIVSRRRRPVKPKNTPKKVAAFDRNHWQHIIGMGGRVCSGLSSSKAKYGKGIQRSEYQELIETNKERVKQNATYYKRRQAIVEHPYGTIKRQWGFNYIITKKTMQRATADVGFMLIAYNLRRLINIIGKHELIKYLGEILSINQLKKLLLKLERHILSYLLYKTKYYSYFSILLLNQ